MSDPIAVILPEKSYFTVLQWLKKAIAKDNSRPALCGLHIQKNRIVVTDGFRLHIWEWDENNPITIFPEGVYLIKSLTSSVVVLEQVEGTSPDFDAVIKGFYKTGMPALSDDNPIIHALANVNPVFLSDACLKSKVVNVRIGHSILKIEVDTRELDEEWSLCAYIMTYYIDRFGKESPHLENMKITPKPVDKENSNDNIE